MTKQENRLAQAAEESDGNTPYLIHPVASNECRAKLSKIGF